MPAIRIRSNNPFFLQVPDMPVDRRRRDPDSLLKEGRIVYSIAATDVEIKTKNKRHVRRILAALVLIRVECVGNC